MDAAGRLRGRLGLFLAALSLLFLFFVFQLLRHPQTAALLISLPNPETLICNLRCLGVRPFLQVLGESGKAILLIFVSFSFFYALSRTVSRMLRTLAFVRRAERKTVPPGDIRQFPFLEKAIVFVNRVPLAFTAGLLRPKVFISTGLVNALNEKELQAVIFHELHHQKSRDPLKGLAVSFLSDFFFFLPISRFLKKAHLLMSEMTADAHSVNFHADPLVLAGSLLKVQKLNGPAASCFFDPTIERTKHLLGERPRIPLPFKKVFMTVFLLAISAFLAMMPVKKNISSMFMNHDKTCVLRSSHQ